MKSTEQNGSTQALAAKKKQRRALIGAISTAGVVGAAKLPGQWTRPVVDQVLLPSHAATTDDSGSSPGANSTSSFITTVTQNCVVTCAQGIMNFYTTSYSADTTVAVVSMFYDGTQIQCTDSLGGMTSTALGGASYCNVYTVPNTQTTFTYLSDYFCSWASSTSNAICTVTQTSSA